MFFEPERQIKVVKRILCCGLVTKLCPTLCDPMDCSPPGSSVHGICQARILEWVAFPFSRASSQPRDHTHVSISAGGFFTTEPPKKSNSLLGNGLFFCPVWLANGLCHCQIDPLPESGMVSAYGPPYTVWKEEGIE